MHWKQVCIIAQAFTASKPGATWAHREPIISIYAPPPPEPDPSSRPMSDIDHALQLQSLQPRLSLFPRFSDFSEDGAWLVRLSGSHTILRGSPHVFFPYVTAPEALRLTLERAWDSGRPLPFARILFRSLGRSGESEFEGESECEPQLPLIKA
jgi:hypothetical protein